MAQATPGAGSRASEKMLRWRNSSTCVLKNRQGRPLLRPGLDPGITRCGTQSTVTSNTKKRQEPQRLICDVCIWASKKKNEQAKTMNSCSSAHRHWCSLKHQRKAGEEFKTGKKKVTLTLDEKKTESVLMVILTRQFSTLGWMKIPTLHIKLR